MSEGVNIPNGWVETTLGKSINLIGGGTPNTKIEEYWNGEIPWLSVVDFNNDNRWVSSAEKSITELGLKNSSTKLLDVGDIIISARGTVGALAQLKKSMAFNQSCYGIKEKLDVTDKNYLFYLLKYSIIQINRNTYGAVFDTITTKTFDFINVIIPKNIEEQKSIAAILTAFDDKIELLQAQNKTLEELAQTIFKEWFGKYSVEDELPEGWRIGKLSEIANLKSGFAFKAEDFIEESNFKAIKIKDLKGNGNISLSDISAITEDITKLGRVQYFKLDEGDILLAMSGNTTGKIGVLPSSENEIYLNQRVGKFFLKNNIYKSYLYNFLMSNDYENKILAMGYGSAQPNINPTQIENIDICYPDERKLNAYLGISNPIFEKVLKNNTQIHTLTQTRDALLPKLMSGEIRVKM
ncbi:restriction endonuclease subunit S [Paenimyroides baculatum]|uniref:Restriction endonuclease subunit S n=1 Tax=Paenimyroides baculatum TaxID=2608000 RepID=A0A5M6CRR2_9FLAO|nr:restriction endonuclease subunit S [Paenimyroides baculatum]KAA5537884.1 restriction endonuclease subunit S [Paenimyroides baculatum]